MSLIKKFELLVFMALVFSLSSSCMTPDMDTSTDAGYTPCTDDFCQTWCEDNFCRESYGLSAWGACIGECAEETDGCVCQDIGCDPTNCNHWCVYDKEAISGTCVEIECLCDFEPDPTLDSGPDSGDGADAGEE